MNKIGNKRFQINRGIKFFLWLLTALSFLFFIYKVVVFSTSVSHYDFELDEEVKPTASMISIYSIGAFIGASIIPIALWTIYGFFFFLKSSRFKNLISNWKSKFNNSKADDSFSKIESKSLNYSSKLIDIFKSINPKTKKLMGIIWFIFHLFMLFTSENIFDYRISWEDFWIFNNWKDYNYSNYGYGGRYDISEFIIYVILPILIIYGRKYLKGEKILNFDMNSSIKKTTTDDRINDLKKYKELFDLGVISEEEFTEIKKKLL
jgi:hypothetical protein